MKVNLYFGILVDVIEFEPFLGNDLIRYKEEFEKWYSKKYCEKKEGTTLEKIYILRKDIPDEYLGAEMFIKWMNEVYPEGNAKVIDKNIQLGQENDNLPYITF